MIARLAALLAVAGACRAQGAQNPVEMGAVDSTDHGAAQAAHEAMSGPMPADPHLRLTLLAPANPADSARAAALVATMRGALVKYRDVAAARADGFRMFLPGGQQPMYHFTSWKWALEAMFRFDPAKPTSLLYRSTAAGRFELVGAMYTAPARTTEAELDRRIPLSVARWHEHVNWCVPPRGALRRWRDSTDGHPVFGPKSPIATPEACAAAGGRFLPRIFGWMVHVNAFAGDDPRVIWGAPQHEHLH